MNNHQYILAIALFIPSFLNSQTGDTTIQQVRIVFEYSADNFPREWRIEEINATGQQIATEEIPRSKQIIAKALNKYGNVLLEYNLKAVFFLKSMQFYNVGFGGTNSTDALYLTNNGIAMGYTDKYIEQTFHHEFSSILFRNYTRFFDTVAWKKANDPSFDYNDPESGVGAIRTGRSSQVPDTALARFGFLTEYSMSGIENDLNTIAQNLFRPDKGFWDAVDKYPAIKTKTQLLISFYHKLGDQYTERFFRNIDE